MLAAALGCPAVRALGSYLLPLATTPGSELAEVQPDLEALAAELPSYSAAVQRWVLRDSASLSLLGLGACGMACLATCRTLYSLLTLIQHGSLRLSDAAWTRLLTAAGKLVQACAVAAAGLSPSLKP